MKKGNVLFIGGDERQIYCAEQLFKHGYEISCYGFDKYDKIPPEFMVFSNLKIAVLLSDYIVFPIPMMRSEAFNAPFCGEQIDIHVIVSYFDAQKIIFGGKLDPSFLEQLSHKKALAFDVLQDEAYTQNNAYLTAEATVYEMLRSTKKSLFGEKVLILGFGRIAKYTLKLLSAFKSEVTIAARKKSDLTIARLLGAKTKELTPEISPQNYDYIINTVPKKLFTDAALETFNGIYLDVAPTDTYRYQRYFKLNALPAACFPESAGSILAQYILATIAEVNHE